MFFFSYLVLFFINLSLFSKFLIIFLFIILIFIIILIFLKLKFIFKYNNEILVFIKEFNDENVDLKEFYNRLLVKKKKLIGMSMIFFSGFREFVYLHRKGISDINIIIKMIKKIMKISLFKEINFLYKSYYSLYFLKKIFIYLFFFIFFLEIILYIHNLSIGLYNNLSINILIISLFEFVCPLFIIMLILFIIDIVIIKYIYFIIIVNNFYDIFINEFIVLLYHKLYD